MFLTIDIGNSAVKFAIYDKEQLIHRFSIPTIVDYEPDELMFERFRYVAERFIRIDTVIASSVVPSINSIVKNACREYLKVTPIFIDSSYDIGLKVTYSPESSLGPDRFVGAYAAATKYGVPVIVCNFGTATTVDLVSNEMVFLGGVIAPGVGTMAAALDQKTANLPLVHISKPEKILGNNTEEAIRSGVFYGSVGLAKQLIRSLSSQIEDSPTVVATGGFSSILAPEIEEIDVVDQTLVLDGLRMIAEMI